MIDFIVLKFKNLHNLKQYIYKNLKRDYLKHPSKTIIVRIHKEYIFQVIKKKKHHSTGCLFHHLPCKSDRKQNNMTRNIMKEETQMSYNDSKSLAIKEIQILRKKLKTIFTHRGGKNFF